MSDILKGKLGWKGERGYSAYEIAVQNGYEGTEQDWLATLGTSSHFDEYYALYTIEDASVKTYDLPEEYVTGTFVNAYLNGEKIPNSLIEVDTANSQVELDDSVTLTLNDKLEIVQDFMSTNNLPIVDTIDSESTNDTAVGALCTYNAIKEVADDVTELSGDVSALEIAVDGIVDTIYPVGSIYLSVVDTNPSTLFGGTWVQISQGRCLVGVGSGTDSRSETKTFTNGETGGEYKHQLTVGELAKHDHNLFLYRGTQSDRGANTIRGIDHDSDWENSELVRNAGNDEAHNNIQPYFAVYMWKRTA